MNMSLSKFLNEVWFIKLHRDIVHHEENNMDKNEFSFSDQDLCLFKLKLEGVEGCVTQTIVEEKELSQRWLG